ncbi:MAG: hypothetical protein UY72_C0024G0010 [Candidatus Uhrbacteria bacterium GW2011_GWD2_52_7]|uniref:Nucleotidyltransferase family protein n=1 Tax=Candidatus Uhrbacteria bacterium GW2011_GWD2_52_7 TaxID=1618989 RepID=A0A0G1XFK9_9BACT|nr:MAG: hypothetical protein UY72_C0024G0010 [Candidatus Uhrbacteria bacterium GW2011_GWD2_52_7]
MKRPPVRTYPYKGPFRSDDSSVSEKCLMSTSAMNAIIHQVKSLNLPLGQYIIVGSGAMSVHGIRPHKDVDLLVTPDLYDELKRRGWTEEEKKPGFFVVHQGDAEASPAMITVNDYQPDIHAVIADADIISGVAFMKLDELVRFKTALGREKDLRDLKLITTYLSRDKKTGLPPDFRDGSKLRRFFIDLQILFHRRPIKSECCESWRKVEKMRCCKGCATLYSVDSPSWWKRFLARWGKRVEIKNK